MIYLARKSSNSEQRGNSQKKCDKFIGNIFIPLWPELAKIIARQPANKAARDPLFLHMFAMHSTRFHLPGGKGNKKGTEKRKRKKLGGIDYRQVLSGGGDQRPNGFYTLFSPFPPNSLVNFVFLSCDSEKT